jgi:hypothetical protein
MRKGSIFVSACLEIRRLAGAQVTICNIDFPLPHVR